jgi:transposase
MLIIPQHQELQERYQKLVLKSMQLDMIIAKKEEENKALLAEIRPLKNMVELLVGVVNELWEERATLLKELEERNRQLQKMELLQHQYDQVWRMALSRGSEKGAT